MTTSDCFRSCVYSLVTDPYFQPLDQILTAMKLKELALVGEIGASWRRA